MFFLPFSFILLIFFILLFPLLIFLVQLGIVEAVSTKLGFPFSVGLMIYFFSLIGSFVNIPLKKEPVQRKMSEHDIFGKFFGLPAEINYRIIAVNLGGCIIPILVSIYLFHLTPVVKTIIGITLMSAACYFIARPIPGIGITIPMLIPPLLCFVLTLIFAPGNPAFAYIVGVLGTLIGADILHLNEISRMKKGGVMSIGGAGVFDGIFLVGIIAVLLA